MASWTMVFFLVLGILVLLGFALTPLMLWSGIWALLGRRESAAKAAEIQQVLDEPDR